MKMKLFIVAALAWVSMGAMAQKTKQVIENVETGCMENTVNIILQHDIKDFSVSAVESVIQWGLNNGYTFKALQLDSPSAHHGVNN